MQPSTTAALRNALAICLSGLTLTAHAAEVSPVSAMRYVSLDASSDNADSRQYSSIGSFTLGNHMWLQGTLGKLTDDSSNGLGDLQNFGIGTGFKGEHVQLSINFSHYKNDDSYKQRDVSAAVEWYSERFAVGVDALHRNIDDSYARSFTDTFPVLGTRTIAVQADEALTGRGFGAHGSVNFTDRFSLSLGGMSYSYDRDVAIGTDVSASQYPLIAQYIENRINTLIQDNLARRSGQTLTRNVVPLDNTYNLGLSYTFDTVGFSAQYIHDKLLDSDATTDTLSLAASLFIGDHWMLAPQIGQSSSDIADDVTFGGLSISYNW